MRSLIVFLPFGVVLLCLYGFCAARVYAQVPLSGQVEDPQRGVTFTVPDGWIGQPVGEGYAFGSRTEKGLLLVMPHAYGSVAELRAVAQEGLTEGPSTRLVLSGAVEPFGERGVAAPFSGTIEGQQARAQVVSVLSPYGGGATVIAAVEAGSFSEAYAGYAEALAASIRFTEPPAPPAGDDWAQKLRGSRLTYLYSYYSGGTGGSYVGASEETVIDLCSAGHFFYSGSHSLAADGGTGGSYGVSGYGGGSQQGHGQWEVVAQEGQPTLVLHFHDGTTRSYELSEEGGKTFLDGERFFRTYASAPVAEHRPQCP